MKNGKLLKTDKKQHGTGCMNKEPPPFKKLCGTAATGKIGGKNMGYRKTGYLEQIWYMIKYAVRSWFEWRDAKAWAEAVHPSWVHIATKASCKETRLVYRDKILKAYQGAGDNG